mmetsp:Transcript_22767/g.21897  ORF Transcript_22767/g.21897 Transcript_22767/m.21897 type:complete len:221 (-) Transcript_22767:2-664(-)
MMKLSHILVPLLSLLFKDVVSFSLPSSSSTIVRGTTSTQHIYHQPVLNGINCHPCVPRIHHQSSCVSIPNMIPTTDWILSSSPSIVISEVETWRQYVPLGVCCVVILDIVLGSPLANLALAPMKRASETDNNDETNDNGSQSLFSKLKQSTDMESPPRSRERIDSKAVAQAALDKAMYSLELRNFLEDNKSDQQRLKETLEKLDNQMDLVDEELDKRRET